MGGVPSFSNMCLAVKHALRIKGVISYHSFEMFLQGESGHLFETLPSQMKGFLSACQIVNGSGFLQHVMKAALQISFRNFQIVGQG